LDFVTVTLFRRVAAWQADPASGARRRGQRVDRRRRKRGRGYRVDAL